MPYIGNEPNFQNFARDVFNGGASSYALTYTPGSAYAALVFVSGVYQAPATDYNISGSTLTPVTVWPAGTSTVVVVYLGVRGDVATPANGTVDAAMLAPTAISGQTAATDLTDNDVVLVKDVSAGVNKYATVQWMARPPLNVNPNWLLDQINEGALYTISGAAGIFGPDGWSGYTNNGAGVFKMRTVADPSNAALKCLEITCTTADTSITAADRYYVYSAIEGYDVADLKAGTASASQITIMFTTSFSVTGVYGISVTNGASNRSYVGTFTQAVANATEQQSITLTLDTGGTWLYTNSYGLYVRVCLAGGTDFQTTAGSWQAGNLGTTSSQVNFMSSTSNIGYLGRFHVIPGGLALPYFGQDIRSELAKGQRYYGKSYAQGTVAGTVTNAGRYINGIYSSGGNALCFAPFKQSMRAVPIVTGYSNITGASGKAGDGASVDQTVTITAGSDSCDFSINTGSTIAITGHYTANARLS